MENSLRTGLRIPTKIKKGPPSSPSRGAFSELNESSTNARGASNLPTIANKHKPSGCKEVQIQGPARLLTCAVPEPPLKRISLQDRAGQPTNPKGAAPPNIRPVNGSVRNTMTKGTRPFSASTSRAPGTSRHASVSSVSSFGGSVNGQARPKTAMHNRSRSQHHATRPGTSMVEREEEVEFSKKGAYPLSISTNPNSHHRDSFQPVQQHGKVRAVSDPHVFAARAISPTQMRASQSVSLAELPISPPHETPAPIRTAGRSWIAWAL